MRWEDNGENGVSKSGRFMVELAGYYRYSLVLFVKNFVSFVVQYLPQGTQRRAQSSQRKKFNNQYLRNEHDASFLCGKPEGGGREDDHLDFTGRRTGQVGHEDAFDRPRPAVQRDRRRRVYACD